MPDKTYLLRLKPPGFSTRIVIAETAEIHGEHLILLNSRGQLAGLFVLEMVESWNRL
jgi:phage protein U